MSNVYTGHESEIAADREAACTKVQRAASHLRSAIESLDPDSYLDFLPRPTEAEMVESAIRHAQAALGLLVRECNCGKQLFYQTLEGQGCANCGAYQQY